MGIGTRKVIHKRGQLPVLPFWGQTPVLGHGPHPDATKPVFPLRGLTPVYPFSPGKAALAHVFPFRGQTPVLLHKRAQLPVLLFWGQTPV